jgi:hypothetical protein
MSKSLRTEDALQTARQDGTYRTAFDLGADAAREGRPRCLYNGGCYKDPDYDRIGAIAGGDWAFSVVLGNAWFAGYDSVSKKASV